jgi:hypothetical protein
VVESNRNKKVERQEMQEMELNSGKTEKLDEM